MTTFGSTDDLRGARFSGVDLRGARFQESDLSGVVMRGVVLEGADLDAPWIDEGDPLRVNGVDVSGFVQAELERRFPGRALRHAADPDGLRAAWAAAEAAWSAAVQRVAAMPAGTADVRVDGEWSFAQTLRHLVLAIDLWLGRAVLGYDQPFHPLGLDYTGADDAGIEVLTRVEQAPYDEVLAVRADRVAMVRQYLEGVTQEDLTATRGNPHNPSREVTVLHCVQTILHEEWEHLRFALRDLDALEARATDAG